MTSTKELLRSNGLYFGNLAVLNDAEKRIEDSQNVRYLHCALLGMLAARTPNEVWEELVLKAEKQVRGLP